MSDNWYLLRNAIIAHFVLCTRGSDSITFLLASLNRSQVIMAGDCKVNQAEQRKSIKKKILDYTRCGLIFIAMISRLINYVGAVRRVEFDTNIFSITMTMLKIESHETPGRTNV